MMLQRDFESMIIHRMLEDNHDVDVNRLLAVMHGGVAYADCFYPRRRVVRDHGPDPATTPAQLATHVLHAALRMLPPATRAQYREELDRELAGLAAAGQPRRAQLAYALRAARRLWLRRRALRAPPSE